MLTDFSERNGLNTNTWFRWPNIILYIWKTPASGDGNRHHLDYTLVQFQGSNRMWNVQKSPGAKIYSEHNLIVADTSTRMKKIIRFLQRKPRRNFNKLYSAKRFRRNILSSGIRKWKSVIAWKQYQEMCLYDYEWFVWEVVRRARMPWITQEMVSKIDGEGSRRVSKRK
jgi:hypothetical protein